MSDELTRAIAEALSLGCGCLTSPDRPDGGDSFGCYCECGDEGREDCDHDQPQRIAAALAPLIEARVREALAEGAAGALTSFAYECLDDEDANLAAVRAMQWERQAGDIRADAWGEGYLRGTLDATSDLEPADNPYRDEVRRG